MQGSLRAFKSPKIILVEGVSDIKFFVAFLDHLEIGDFYASLMTPESRIDDVCVCQVKSKDKFKEILPFISTIPGFSDVTHLIIIRDADNDGANNAFKSIQNLIKRAKLTPPDKMNVFSSGSPHIGVYILPDNKNKGMLENLCLESISDEPTLKCLDPFVNCIDGLENPPKNIAKAKVQAYLAARQETARDVGEGAEKGYWNFDADCFTDLKEFLLKLK